MTFKNRKRKPMNQKIREVVGALFKKMGNVINTESPLETS